VRRRLLSLVCCLSLLLCLAAAVLWINSRSWVRVLTYWSHVQGFSVASVPDGFRLTKMTATGEILGWDYRCVGSGPNAQNYDWQFIGFKRQSDRFFSAIVIPYWFASFGLGILPASRLIGYWRRGQKLVKQCRSCGYDLTGNTSGVCPECGTARSVAQSAPPYTLHER
jgi:hypothetical protein